MNAETPFADGRPSVWALVDDRAGNAGQCLGVAEALGWPFLKQELAYTASAALPNFIMGPTFGHLTRDSRVNLMPPWPDLVIAAGRRTASVARNIKAKNGGHTFLAQIMHPGEAGTDEFDLIAVPRHDNLSGDNILAVTGAPHRVTPARLAEAAEAWRPRLEAEGLPRPWIALVVGGSTKRRTFTEAMAGELGAIANRLAEAAGGSLLVTTSRRTGEAVDALLAPIAVPAHVFRWDEPGAANPYFGYLALADYVVVTGESGSMVSEACAAPGAVYIHAPRRLVPHKFTRLHEELYAKGYARPLADALEPFEHPVLNAADDIAAEIRRRLGVDG